MLAETRKKLGAGCLPRPVSVRPCPFNWLGQITVVFEDSTEMDGPDMEHQLSAQPRHPHLALLEHALIDQLVHRKFDVGGCGPFALGQRQKQLLF